LFAEHGLIVSPSVTEDNHLWTGHHKKNRSRMPWKFFRCH